MYVCVCVYVCACVCVWVGVWVGVCVSYLVIQGQVTEGWDVFGPLHQHQQLLLHGLTHVCDGGDLFGPYVAVQYRSRGGDLDTQM